MGRHSPDRVLDEPPAADPSSAAVPPPREVGTHRVERFDAETAVIDLRLVHARRRASQVALAGDIVSRTEPPPEVPVPRHRHRSPSRRARPASGRHCR